MPERQPAERRAGSCVKTTTSQRPWPSPRRHQQRRRIVRHRRQRREQVLEDGDVVAARWQLGRPGGIGRRRQRVVFGRRQERPVLPVRGIRHPFAAQRMPAQVRVRRADGGSGTGPARSTATAVASRRESVPGRPACVNDCADHAFGCSRRHRLSVRPTAASGSSGGGSSPRSAAWRLQDRRDRNLRRPIGAAAARWPPDRCRRIACSRSPTARRASERPRAALV